MKKKIFYKSVIASIIFGSIFIWSSIIFANLNINNKNIKTANKNNKTQIIIKGSEQYVIEEEELITLTISASMT